MEHRLRRHWRGKTRQAMSSASSGSLGVKVSERENGSGGRRFSCMTAALAVCVASLPSGSAFVAPPCRVPHTVTHRGSTLGAWESQSFTNRARRRRLPSGNTHMIAAEPRVQDKDISPATVVPARTPGKEGPHLPWTQSAAGPEFSLNYMPFMEHMLNLLAESFRDMRAEPLADRLAFVENPEKKARMLSMHFASPEIRKARMTYFDAGDNVQVLNAVIYPDSSLDFPILGIDLISFGGKHLAGIDFQPLFDDEACRTRYTEKLKTIKTRYPEFAQSMSARFYDSARFFSDEMLFGRYEDHSLIDTRLFPAFEEYLRLYISDIMEAAAQRGDSSPETRTRVLDRHRAYDQYNAERDPAHGLFRNYFGAKFSEEFMDEFLFELSTRPEGGYPRGPPRKEREGGRK